MTVSSAQKPDGKTVTISVYKAGLQSAGAALVVLGVFIAYFIKVYAPARLTRSRELEAVALLETEIDKLRRAVNTVPAAKAPNVGQALQQLVADLSIHNLEARNFIHRVPPLPFADNIDAGGFAKLLIESGLKVALIGIIVRDGLLEAKALEALASGHQNLIDQAYAIMDNRLGQNPTPTTDQLRTQILADLVQLKANLHAAAGPLAVGGVMPGQSPPSSLNFERLQLSIEELSATIWLFWAFLTAFAGIVFQVAMNLSFGRPQDYLYCLLWGVGITAAGQQLTSSTITTGIGVTLPKTN